MESFSEKRQMARVAAGFKGGNWFSKPILHNGKMSFVDGHPSEITEKSGMKPIKQATPTDPWNERRKK